MANNITYDVGYKSINHYGEELCGDHVERVSDFKHGTFAVVLADGLGSGVKANILSILTSKIISTMMANGAYIEDCVATIASTLPVCKLRGVAYSTFSIAKVIKNNVIEIYEYDNPHFVMLRNGVLFEPVCETLTIEGKLITKSTINVEENDTLIFFSDGAVHAGIGAELNFGRERNEIAEFMQNMYDHSYSAKTLCTILSDKCNQLYEEKPGDDTTVLVIKARKKNDVNLVFGPPRNAEDDAKMCEAFFTSPGKHIVSGGTTCNIISRYLHKPISAELDMYVKNDIPPMAKIEGCDLVTEGVITLSKVVEYASSFLYNNEKFYDWLYDNDGASLITRCLLEEATDISFFVGTAINPAHQNPNLPISFNIKMRIIEELASKLREIGKRVTINYF
ncbi:MAG: SpoIIE family protein phosphatase [Bacilli bacterium]